MSLTLILTIYGSVLSTSLGVLRIQAWMKDRPQLKVLTGHTVFTFPGTTQPAPGVMFQCVNNGKAPITVTDWGYTGPHKGWGTPIFGLNPEAIARPAFPVLLAPGDIVRVVVSTRFLYTEVIDHPYAEVAFVDANNRRHYCVQGVRGWRLRRQIFRRDPQKYEMLKGERLRAAYSLHQEGKASD